MVGSGGSGSTLSGAGASNISIPTQTSSCVEPDHRELIRSVSTVLYRRIRDNETADTKFTLPLFCEDTHTEPPAEDQYSLTLPLLHLQMIACPTLYTLVKLPPPPAKPIAYPVPDVQTIIAFIENIWKKARLTPQSVVITLVYVDRLEARSEGVLLHARSWRPIVFASLLLASKVYHDVSYWNSDFSSICPMFNIRNINSMERAYLQLLEYNTIISASQYAQYYFSLRHAVRQHDSTSSARNPAGGSTLVPGNQKVPSAGTIVPTAGQGTDNFRSKYFMAINVPGAVRLEEQSAALAQNGPGGQLHDYTSFRRENFLPTSL